MGMARILGFCVAFLFASSVAAAVTIDLGPSDYRSFGPNGAHTSGGIRSSTGQTVRMPPTLGTLSVMRNPVIPYGSVANGLRVFTRINPASVAASAAVTGLFLAVDWVFDQDRGEWVKEGIDAAPLEPGSLYWYSSVKPSEHFSDPLEACNNTWGSVDPPQPITSVIISGNIATCRRNNSSVGSVTRVGDSCPVDYDYNPANGRCERGVLIDLDESDWTELAGYLPSANPQSVSDAAGDAQRRIGDPLPGYHDQSITGPSSVTGSETTSTSTDPVTGDTVVTTTNTTTNISYGDTTITTTNTTTSTTYQNGEKTGETVTTETPGELPVSTGGGASGDWPGFCDWATVVCDWLNWTQEEPPPDVDLPSVIDDDFFEQKNISFGAKSCPPDYEVNLTPFLDTTVGVSFQPLCDFAGLIYYMVMAASYIIAAYISIGVARNA